ncbi:MAG TPA: T9SS type A sorting domain-containing protein, partial [Chryseosolibacter sp.]|nr:T9SS type A sorting domain-containing protein [Chryseosolibacter sp.]
WTKYSSQQSSPITLQTGQRYYIEALHKQGVGSDNISVGWQLPDGNLERPIPGTRLSPAFDAAMTAQSTAARSASDTDEEYEVTSYQEAIEIYPNPATTGMITLTLPQDETISGNELVVVEIVGVTGEVVYSRQINCTEGCAAIEIEMNDQFNPGIYMVNMKNNQKRYSTRLLVK